MSLRFRSALKRLVPVVALAPLLAPWSCARDNASTATSVESPAANIPSLFEEEWQYTLRSNPEGATMLGDNRYNDRLSDRSPEFYKSDVDQKTGFLSVLWPLDLTGLAQQDTLSRALDDSPGRARTSRARSSSRGRCRSIRRTACTLSCRTSSPSRRSRTWPITPTTWRAYARSLTSSIRRPPTCGGVCATALCPRAICSSKSPRRRITLRVRSRANPFASR